MLVKIKITRNHQLKITILASVSQGSAGCNLALEGQPVPGQSSHFVKGSAFDAMLQQFQPPVWPISWPWESLFACLFSAVVGDAGHATLLYGRSHCGWHPKSAQCPLSVSSRACWRGSSVLSLNTSDGVKTSPRIRAQCREMAEDCGVCVMPLPGPLLANLVPTAAADGARQQRLCSVGGSRRATNQRQGAGPPGFPRGKVPQGWCCSVILH